MGRRPENIYSQQVSYNVHRCEEHAGPEVPGA